MGIGERLTQERKRLGLSQLDFAKQAQVSLSSQKRYETGERAPDTSYLEGIKRIGVDVNYVINDRKRRYSLGDRNPDSALLARVIESVETVLANSGLVLDPDKKARTVVRLYKAFRESGSVDFQLVKEAISLAGQ